MSTFAINYCYILYKKISINCGLLFFLKSFHYIKYTIKNITVLAPTSPHHLKFAKLYYHIKFKKNLL